MIEIDRERIDDIGGNPSFLAEEILRQIGIGDRATPVRDVARAVDIDEIREEELHGFEGALVTTEAKLSGKILVNRNQPETRKRFTIAHELGHYLNAWHQPPTAKGFECSGRDFLVTEFSKEDRAARMEAEANEFAAELLMPARVVKKAIASMTGVDLSHVLQLAKKFDVSKEAAARRYVDLQSESIALVFSKDGVVRYVKKGKHFPRLNVWRRDLLPEASATRAIVSPPSQISAWHTRPCDVWLQRNSRSVVCEQILAQQDGFRMTLLALDDGDVEDETSEWTQPSFYKRHR